MAILICVICGCGFQSADLTESQCHNCKSRPLALNCKECGRTFVPTDNCAFGRCSTCERISTVAQEEALNVYLVLVSFDGPDDMPIPKIEITILHTAYQSAGVEVTKILKDQGYPTHGMNITVKEIHGPFEAGYVIARHGG